MHKKKKLLLILLVLAGMMLLAVACSSNEPGENEAAPPDNNSGEAGEDTSEDGQAEPAPELFGDSLRGGLLYDKWWSPLGLDAPEEDQALWATQSTNTRSGADTWRCKECHGWDYKGADGAYASGSHFTGFTGIIQFAGGDPNEVLAALQGATNSDHDFSAVMDEQALTDIALFISDEVIDFSTFIGEDKMAYSTDLAGGEELWSGTCADCHGPEGLAINFDSTVSDSEYISGLSNGNPWEVFHKMRFGQPGVPEMASAIDSGWTVDEQAAVLAYAQSFPASNSVTEGGLIYDKWWKALDIDAPEMDQPLWASQSTNERSGSDSWRCKECHGWDYQGADGAYGSGSHFTGFTGVLGASGASAEELTAWLDGSANSDHDFSAYMDEAAVAMVVDFLQNGVFDMSVYVNEDKTANGDPVNGEAFYGQACARCHGDDGQGINFGDDDDPEYLGGIATGNPWEFLHKAGNGQPGSHMTIGFNMGWSAQDLADILAYVQTLE